MPSLTMIAAWNESYLIFLNPKTKDKKTNFVLSVLRYESLNFFQRGISSVRHNQVYIILLIFEMFYHLFNENVCIGEMQSPYVVIMYVYSLGSIYGLIQWITFLFGVIWFFVEFFQNWGECAIKLNDTNVVFKLRTIQFL